MLTKSDLRQIGVVVRGEVKDQLSSEAKSLRTEIKEDTKSIIKLELKTIKEDIEKIRKDAKTIVNFFDREYLELRERVERIENFLKIPASN